MKTTPEMIKAVIEALKNSDGEAALTLLEQMLTEESGEPAEPGEGNPGDAAGEPAGTPPTPAGTPPSNAADAPATAMLLRVTGARNLAEAEPILRSAVTSARTIDADRMAVTMTARRELIVELIQLGAETPATAWEGRPEDRKPVARLVTETLEGMRARIVSLKARNPGASSNLQAPLNSGDVAAEVAKLDKATLAKIKQKGMTPEEFIAERSKATRRTVVVRTPPTAAE